jgi:hypothetical protein
MKDGVHSIIRSILLYYEPAQDLADRVPVHCPHARVLQLGNAALGVRARLADAATIAKCTSALSICPNWRYTLTSAERSSPSMLLVVDVVDDCFFGGNWLEQRGGGGV